LTPPSPGIVEAFCIGSCQDLFRGEDWRLGLVVSLKSGGGQRDHRNRVKRHLPAFLQSLGSPFQIIEFDGNRPKALIVLAADRPWLAE
jgi:hypothetical protein